MNGQFGIFPIVSFAAGGGVLDLAGARGLHLLCTVGIKLISISGAGTDLLIQPHAGWAAVAMAGSAGKSRKIQPYYAGSRTVTNQMLVLIAIIRY